MLKFVMTFTYSSASCLRMVKMPDDRSEAVAALLEHLHGSLESIYREVESGPAYVVADLPDSISAAAASTGASGRARSGMCGCTRYSPTTSSGTWSPWRRALRAFTARPVRELSSGKSSVVLPAVRTRLAPAA